MRLSIHCPCELSSWEERCTLTVAVNFLHVNCWREAGHKCWRLGGGCYCEGEGGLAMMAWSQAYVYKLVLIIMLPGLYQTSFTILNNINHMGQALFLLYPWFNFCAFVSDQTQTSTWPYHQQHFESRNDNEGCLFTKSCLNNNPSTEN